MRISKVGWILGLIGVLVLGNALAALGDVEEHLNRLHPYISVQELYDSNIYLTQDNTQSDFITTISPGLKYTAKGPIYNFDLDFKLGLNFYASNSENNYISYDGILNTYYSFDPRWTVRLYETLTRSRNQVINYSLVTPAGEQTSTFSSNLQGLYLRNIFQPSLEYKFGRENLAFLLYRNMIYREDGGTGNDSMENSVNPHLTYWFDIRNGIGLDYIFDSGRFTQSDDFVRNTLAARYYYRFNPQTTAFAGDRLELMDYASPGQDYSIHSPRVGIDHAVTPTLSVRAEFGWFWQMIDAGSSFNGPVYYLGATQRGQKTVYTLSIQGGYQYNYYTSDNLGLSKYDQATAAVTYKLWERVTLGLAGNLWRNEYQNPERLDWTWSVKGSLAYQLWRWLTVNFEVSNESRDSDSAGDSYRDNKVLLRITAEF
jgi:hypothetical protein